MSAPVTRPLGWDAGAQDIRDHGCCWVMPGFNYDYFKVFCSTKYAKFLYIKLYYII